MIFNSGEEDTLALRNVQVQPYGFAQRLAVGSTSDSFGAVTVDSSILDGPLTEPTPCGPAARTLRETFGTPHCDVLDRAARRDGGNPAALLASESATDITGAPRVQSCPEQAQRRDIGPEEFEPFGCTPDPSRADAIALEPRLADAGTPTPTPSP